MSGVTLRVKDGERLEEFLNRLRQELEIEVVEDPELSPSPALRAENICYHGVPAHREAEAFVEILRMLTGADGGGSAPISQKVEIKIFTTPTCRYCPRAVLAAAELALGSEMMEVHIYDALEFRELAREYEVTAVPKIVVNEAVFIEAQTTRKKYRELLLNAVEQLSAQARPA